LFISSVGHVLSAVVYLSAVYLHSPTFSDQISKKPSSPKISSPTVFVSYWSLLDCSLLMTSAHVDIAKSFCIKHRKHTKHPFAVAFIQW